jgi:stage IV sporulation protein B
MRRTYTLLFLLILTFVIGFAAEKSEATVAVFTSRRGAAETMPDIKVVPLGITIGVRINTDGVMVLGTGDVHGADGQIHSPSENKLLAGDLILEINNIPVNDKEALSQLVADSEGDLIL